LVEYSPSNEPAKITNFLQIIYQIFITLSFPNILVHLGKITRGLATLFMPPSLGYYRRIPELAVANPRYFTIENIRFWAIVI
jgi:hypothetical protein